MFFLVPGQGSQKPGMGQDFYDQSPAARAVFEAAAALSPPGFVDTLFHGEQEILNDTRVAQPALLTCSVAIGRHLMDAGITPLACCGHSLGEIGALVLAGAVEFEDALRFTQIRAKLMSEDIPEGGMAAVMGLDADAIEAALPNSVQVANFNGPGQTIISGSTAGLAAAEEALKAAGAKRVMPLKVSGPFHSQYMRPAAEAFAEALTGVAFRAPATRFVSSVTGGDVSDPEQIRHLLVEQLYSPVRWTQTMQALGAGVAVEVGPGNVLKGLAKRIDGAPEVATAGSLEEVSAIASAS
jgi:[acyl-carrier-protein] S-malonyltransferase